LRKNIIHIEGNELSFDERTEIRDLLEQLITLQPNANYLFFIPKERGRLKYRTQLDTPGINKLIMKLDSEAPALVDSLNVNGIADNVVLTLRSMGYFNARHETSVEYKLHTAVVTYSFYTGNRYKLEEGKVVSEDSTLVDLIKSSPVQSAFIPGRPVSSGLYAAETRRITNILRNQGYYAFSSNNFSRFQVRDTSNHRVKLNLQLKPSAGDSVFRKYKIRDVHIYPAYNAEIEKSLLKDTLIGEYWFHINDENTIVKPKHIIEELDLVGNAYYSDLNHSNTLQNLYGLDIFKFPRINVEPIQLDSSYLDYHIYLRKNKKFSDELRLETFFASVTTFRSLGFSVGGSRTIRNTFGGSERLVFSLDAGIETAFEGTDEGNILTIGLGTDLFVPRFKDWTRSLWFINKLRIGKYSFIGDKLMNDLKDRGESFIRVRYEYEDNQQLYNTNQFTGSYGVGLRKGTRKKYDITLVNLNYWRPIRKDSFETVFGNDEAYIRSFTPQLLTGFLFSSIDFSYESHIYRKKQYGANVRFEISGHEIAAINGMSQLFGGDNLIKGVNLRGDEEIGFSQFFTLDLQGRHSKTINSRSSIAFRANTAVGIGFGNSPTIPYSKLFSLGGAYSMRAWDYRAVGPGGSYFEDVLSGDVRPYSAGEFKLEFNAEYRFDLFWWFEGALFVDAGNIWRINKSSNDISSLSSDFLEQVAVGSGFGLRLDLTYFLLRFDFGHPIRNWYKDPETDRYMAVKQLGDFELKKLNTVFGINYPF
jgi:hypothetical protein